MCTISKRTKLVLYSILLQQFPIQSEKNGVRSQKVQSVQMQTVKNDCRSLPGIIVDYWSPACLACLFCLCCAAAVPSSLCGEPIFSIFQPFEKPPIQSIFYTPYAKQLRGHTNTRGACHILHNEVRASLTSFQVCILKYAIKARVRNQTQMYNFENSILKQKFQ